MNLRENVQQGACVSEGPLLRQLAARAESGRPLRVGLIGAGKFGTMFLSQAGRIPGLHVLGVADLSVERIRQALKRAEWPPGRDSARTFDQAISEGTTHLTDDAEVLINATGLDVLVEATGNPEAGAGYALKAFENGRHVVMVNVEADALVGPVLAKAADSSGVVYSLAYGDQPALICEMVEWARVCGFRVVCAGKGTRHLPAYHASTPDTVWEHYGFSAEKVAEGAFNPRMFNAFLDGTKSAIEMAAVANATGLQPQKRGLTFPPCSISELPNVCRPKGAGGQLEHGGTVEVVSSLERDGRTVKDDLRWGVYVTFEAGSDYVKRCFDEYGLLTDDDEGRYAAMYRSHHLVGMELAVSVLKAGLRREATGCPDGFRADVVATAKRDLTAGEVLDGEGGYCVYGRLMRAEAALEDRLLPIGLAKNAKLKRAFSAGQQIGWSDVEIDESASVVRLRRRMEREVSGA
jgi:predicted homoserine dehydrogenase-like protein